MFVLIFFFDRYLRDKVAYQKLSFDKTFLDLIVQEITP